MSAGTFRMRREAAIAFKEAKAQDAVQEAAEDGATEAPGDALKPSPIVAKAKPKPIATASASTPTPAA